MKVSGVRVMAVGNNHARGIRNSEVGMWKGKKDPEYRVQD